MKSYCFNDAASRPCALRITLPGAAIKPCRASRQSTLSEKSRRRYSASLTCTVNVVAGFPDCAEMCPDVTKQMAVKAAEAAFLMNVFFILSD